MTDKPKRLGVIDVGTNSVRLFAVEIGGDEIRVLDDFGEVTRLGRALARDGSIADEDAAKTLEFLKTCVARAESASLSDLDIAGTEVFRAAGNGADVAAMFSRILGHVVRILSPDEEAEASYLGVVGWEENQDPGPAVILDVGGGSTEIVAGEGVVLQFVRSVPLGALRVTEACFRGDPPAAAEVEEARTLIKGALGLSPSVKAKFSGRLRAVAVGGTACAIGAHVHRIRPYDPEALHGRSVRKGELDQVIQTWSTTNLASRMEADGMSEGRAAVVLGGALIFERLIAWLEVDSIQISTRGLRHGLILRRLLLS